MRYPALIEYGADAIGVIFPDLPGCVAAAATIDQALLNAEDALRGWVAVAEEDGDAVPPPRALEEVAVPAGHALVSVPLIRPSGVPVRANLSLDAGVAAFIDDERRRRGMTRRAYVEWMARRIAQMGG